MAKKISRMKLKNFAQFDDFEIIYKDDVTRLVGLNGSGKTTVGLKAVWAGLKGISERSGRTGQLIGDRFRFIGQSGKSSDIEIDLFDEVTQETISIQNHITKNQNKITFKVGEDSKLNLPDNWLENLLSIAFLSAKNFATLNPKEQALQLGIDTYDHDDKIKILKEEATLLKRDKKKLQLPDEPVKQVEKVEISSLIIQREELADFNRVQHVKASNISHLQGIIEQCDKDIESWQEKIEQLKAKKIKSQEKIESITVLPLKDEEIADIDAKIKNAEQINSEAAEYERYLVKKEEGDKIQKDIDANAEKIAKAQEERLTYIKSFKLDFQGLTFDENGGLLFNDRPIQSQYYSKGELEIIVAKLHANTNPELKVRFIDDFELLDENNQEKVVKSLLDDGFQVITAEVGERTPDKDSNIVVLRGCKIVDEDDDQQKENIEKLKSLL